MANGEDNDDDGEGNKEIIWKPTSTNDLQKLNAEQKCNENICVSKAKTYVQVSFADENVGEVGLQSKHQQQKVQKLERSQSI